MKYLLFAIIAAILVSCESNNKHKQVKVAQKKHALSFSGDYDGAGTLHVAFNPINSIVTGYFEDGTGKNEKGVPQFSCSFYIEGKLVNNEAHIKTYWPPDEFLKGDDDLDLISGTLKLISDKKIAIKLSNEHGGCAMTDDRFSDTTVISDLDKKQSWIEIRYITTNKVYFYSGKDQATRMKAYVVKGNIVTLITSRATGSIAHIQDQMVVKLRDG